jgi:glycosyltransferase involved in cell wall biosynthesis
VNPINIDPDWYLKNYPDVLDAGMEPKFHFESYGRWEGRQPYRLDASGLEHDLWRGMAIEAVPRLTTLTCHPDVGERIWSCWALARWYAAKSDWVKAEQYVSRLVNEPALDYFVPVPGPLLIAVASSIASGDLLEAEKRHNLVKSKVELRDWLLLEASLAVAKRDEARMLSSLRVLFGSSRKVKLRLRDGHAPALDRLEGGTDQGIWPKGFTRLLGRSSTVSIIMPAHNAEESITSSLRSLLSQTWTDLEIIVVDDASTDGTVGVAEDVARVDSRVRILKSGVRSGAYICRNRGLSEASGQFFTVHDADDWAHPEKIERQARALLRDPRKIASVSSWARVTPNLVPYHWRVHDSFIHRNTSSLMLRMEARDRVGYWDRVKADGDTEYYYRIRAIAGDDAIVHVRPDHPLSLGRVHPDSLTQQSNIHISSQLFGVRQTYQTNARSWHAENSSNSRPLSLPQFPEERPFPVPCELSVGDRDGKRTDYDVIAKSVLFDARWYLKRNIDIRRTFVDPALHYLEHGAQEARDPSSRLNTSAYRAAYGSQITNPILHWENLPPQDRPSPLPTFEGAVVDGISSALVFAHASEKELFGAERSLLDVLDSLVRVNILPKLVLPKVGSKDYLNSLLKRTHRIFVCNFGWWDNHTSEDASVQEMIHSMIVEQKPEFVCVNTIVLQSPLVAARSASVPTVTYVRELPDQDPELCEIIGLAPDKIRNALLSMSDRFIANSSLTAEWLNCPSRTTIVGNSVDSRLFNLEMDDHINTLRFSLISSNLSKKGLRHAIGLAEKLLSSSQNAKVQLIGPISDDLKMHFPLPSNVVAPGYIGDPVEAMAITDVLLSLSDFSESFGRTVLEAQAAGRPVICFDNGYPAYLVENGSSGFVVGYANLEELLSAATTLIHDRIKLKSFSEAARFRAREILETSRNQADHAFRSLLHAGYRDNVKYN